MRLGFWNRLAVVLSVLALLIGPPAVMLSMAADAQKAEGEWFETCKALANEQPEYSEQRAARDRCLDEYINSGIVDAIWSWSNWSELALAFGILCATIYALIFATQWVVRWVLRGREQSSQD